MDSDPELTLTLREAWFAATTVRRAVRVAAIVGTVLVAINQGDALLAGKAPPLWKVLMTYLVPYSVSSWSSAAAMREGQSKEVS